MAFVLTTGIKIIPALLLLQGSKMLLNDIPWMENYIDTIPLPGAWVCRPVIKGDYLYAAVLQTNARLDEKSGFVLILDKNYKVVSNLGGNLPAYTE